MDKKFLDEVVDHIVSETTIDYEKERIHHTFPSLSYITADFPSSLSPATEYYFSRHCMDVYGLKDVEEIDYVYTEYKRIIKEKLDSKENLNESKGINKKFLNKVTDQLVSETEIDYEKKIITTLFPSSSPLVVSYYYRFLFIFSYYSLSIHLKEIYGLKDVEEIDYVWWRYGDIIKGKIKSKENLNESKGINKKFLDKVTDQLVSETEIDYEKEEMNVPFQPFYYLSSSLFLSLPYPFSYFKKHCSEVYGLNDDEVNYVWDKFIDIIKGKVKSKKNLNEKFLDKVVDQLVSETKIGYEKEEMNVPFLPPSPPSSSHVFSLSFPLSYFKKHCSEVYGLNDDEVNYVWDEYSLTIKGKL